MPKANGPELVFEAYPATRLSLRIMDDHFSSNLSASKRLKIIEAMFEPQVIEYGFTGDNSMDRNAIDHQWRRRHDTLTKQEKWAPILKEREDMDGKELWAYIWLYDGVCKAAEEFNFGPPVKPLLKYYGTGAEDGFRLEVKVTDEV